MKRTILQYIILIFIGASTMGYAQIGIGTTTPTAELEIATEATGLPPIELQPQTTPTGTVTGQIAVIGDIPYAYDSTRDKWLSLEQTSLQYNKRNDLTDQPIRLGGDVRTIDAGPLMPFDGTIVFASADIASGEQTQNFEILVRNGNTTLSTTPLSLASGEYQNTSLDIDFSAGDYIVVQSTGGTTVFEPAFTLWINWRVDN